MPKFLLKFHAAVIKEIPLDKTPITIGRKADNDIVIDNMSVSSHHTRIIMQGNTYVVEDLQSTNGTFVNDKKIINSALKHNDQILIGQHTIVFLCPEAQGQQPAAPVEHKVLDSESTVILNTAPPPPQAKAAEQAPQPQVQAAAQTTEPGQAAAEPQPAAPQPAVQQAPSAKAAELIGSLRLIEGKAEQPEYILTGLLTYIGKSETAVIKIKGLFAPDIAALISRRPVSYLITAVKDGYPKLNGNSLSGQIELKDGDIIEVGGLKFLFQMKEAKS